MFHFATFYTADFPLTITAQLILGRGAGTLALRIKIYFKEPNGF